MWNKGETKIPAKAQSELVRRRQAGATWTSLSEWLKSAFGIEIHRTNIQRWYDKEVWEEEQEDSPAADNLSDRIKLDKKVQHIKVKPIFIKNFINNP